MQVPKVGDVVHYLADGTRGMTFCQAAIVTHVWDETTVNLYVFPDTSFPDEIGISGSKTSVKFAGDRQLHDPAWHYADHMVVRPDA